MRQNKILFIAAGGIYGPGTRLHFNFAAMKTKPETFMRIELPKAAEWSVAGNYAENLRSATIAGHRGCVPVGHARTLLADAGAHTAVLTDGRVVSVGTDLRTLSIDGSPAGTLGADFLSALADGGQIIIFTTAGAEWFSDGTLQGAAPGAPEVSIGLNAQTVRFTAEVVPPSPLKGTYNRLSESLQAIDRQAMVAPVEAALRSVRAQALLRGMLTQPSWISWQMKDIDGRVIARGEPARFGSLQGNTPLAFRAGKSGTVFSPTGSATLAVEAYGLNIEIARARSEFWQKRVRMLEVIMWADCMRVKGTTGHFTELDSSTSTLTVTPQLEETERGEEAVVAARIDYPLLGVSANLALDELEWCTPGAEAVTAGTSVTPTEICPAGSINVYVPAGAPGSVEIAPAGNPLHPQLRATVCRGRILRVCPPVGSGGGWNYGRHHLLAFATDGIYAVSIDSALTRLSATRICTDGIVRPDAVTASPDAVYVATASGRLLALTGTRTREVAAPVAPVALGWSATFSELLVLGADGRIAAIGADGRASMRSLFRAGRMVGTSMAVDSAGALRDLAVEDAGPVPVVWRRREPDADSGKSLWRRAVWMLDSERAIGLSLAILADGGGTPQRLIELTVNGPVNAPLTAAFRAPRRPYLTAELHGVLVAPARLLAVAT